MNELGVAGAECSSLKTGGVELGESWLEATLRGPGRPLEAGASTQEHSQETLRSYHLRWQTQTVRHGRDGVFRMTSKAPMFARTGDPTDHCIIEQHLRSLPAHVLYAVSFRLR